MRRPRLQTALALIGTIALNACARPSPVAAPNPAPDGFVHPIVRDGIRPMPAVLPDFLPTETVWRPRLRINCTAYPPGGLWAPDEEKGDRPNWYGVRGDIDEAGQLIAWVQAIVDPTAKTDEAMVGGPRYVFRVDNIRNGSTVHAIPLPSLPGMFPPGKCKTWRSSKAITEHEHAIEQVNKILSRYVFRHLHSEADEEKEWGMKMSLDLLRKRQDPAGDWTESPPNRNLSMQDEGPFPAGFLRIVVTPTRSERAYVVALRCAGALALNLECVGPERAVVFASSENGPGQVLISHDFEKQDVFGACSGEIDWIHGVSPRRGLAVFTHATGFWASVGRDEDRACRGLEGAHSFRVLRASSPESRERRGGSSPLRP